MDLSDMREHYAPDPLRLESLNRDPFAQFESWFQEVCDTRMPEPNAFSLATATTGAAPSLRTILLKYFDTSGFVFFTNYESDKAREISENPNVCMLFPWVPLARQIVIKGCAAKIPASESLRYFLKRPRDSQLGAWISRQSEVISSRQVLEAKLREIKERFAKGNISLPPAWGGYRVTPSSFEFWQGGPDRLHDRFLYTRQEDDTPWQIQRLSP